MSLYIQLKSPLATKLDEGLDRKAEFMDEDGVLRRSSSVTHRMVQKDASVKEAEEFKPEEQLHDSIDTRVQLGEIATPGCTTNTTLKGQIKTKTENDLKKENEEAHRFEELHQVWHALIDFVDVTENSTASSPSKTKTYIDQEGNLRRRITTPPVDLHEAPDAFVPGYSS